MKCFVGNESLQGIRNHFHSCNEYHVLVLDEIDFLHTGNEMLLYNLFEIPFIEDARVFLIAISNTLGALSLKLESRIGKERLDFKPYNSLDLRNIITSGTFNNLQNITESNTIEISKIPVINLRKHLIKHKTDSENPVISGTDSEHHVINGTDSKCLELISKRVASATGDIRKVIEIIEQVGNSKIEQVHQIIKDILW